MSATWPGASLAEAIVRKRVTLGFLAGALVLWLAEPTPSTLASGTVVAMVGEGLRLWAAGHLSKAREVTTSGPYRWFAHPLYVGSSIMGVGLALIADSLAVTAIVGVYLVMTLTAAVRNEEAFLRRTFGDRYDRYRRADWTGGDAAEPRRFSMARAIANHEHRAVVGLAVAILLLALKATYNDGSLWRATGKP